MSISYYVGDTMVKTKDYFYFQKKKKKIRI